MRKLILSAVFTMAATSAALAMGGAGYNGTVVANVYQYLAAHGCPDAGFGLFGCGYYRSAPDDHGKPSRRLNTH
jgi:hypothetical protein